VTHPLLAPGIVHAVERAAARHRGRRWTHTGFTDLSHRASHPCGIFAGTPFSVFAKLDDSPDGPEQFTAERNGLALIRSRTGVATPVPVAGGVVLAGAGALLLSEALAERGPSSGQSADSRTPDDFAAIGHTLAALHQARGQTFGLAQFDGFFGPLRQSNRPVGSGRWADFYAERRVLPMLRLAVDSGHLPAVLARGAERIAGRLSLLCGPEPGPALLHGDAQQNNFIAAGPSAVVIDVAPYFGHPEADLALTDLFYPVGPELLRAYRESMPVDDGFAGRRDLWRLHAYLAAIAVGGTDTAGRSFLPRLAASVRQYT
jgi:fructosamine-3-kinase